MLNISSLRDSGLMGKGLTKKNIDQVIQAIEDSPEELFRNGSNICLSKDVLLRSYRGVKDILINP